MTANLGAWHGDPQLKADTVAELIKHREADAITKGIYQRLDPDLAVGFRGCAVGCLVAAKRDPRLYAEDPDNPVWVIEPNPNGDWHGEAERLYGIPVRLLDDIEDVFESFPTGVEAPDAHARFVVEVIDAIPVGANLKGIRAHGMSLRTEIDEVTAIAAELIADLKAAPTLAVAE